MARRCVAQQEVSTKLAKLVNEFELGTVIDTKATVGVLVRHWLTDSAHPSVRARVRKDRNMSSNVISLPHLVRAHP